MAALSQTLAVSDAITATSIRVAVFDKSGLPLSLEGYDAWLIVRIHGKTSDLLKRRQHTEDNVAFIRFSEADYAKLKFQSYHYQLFLVERATAKKLPVMEGRLERRPGAALSEDVLVRCVSSTESVQHRVADLPQEAIILRGDRGAPGDDGKSIQGPPGPPGKDGKDGKDGKPGPIGPMPDHQWRDTWLRFQKPDGRWGDFVDLKGEKGDPGVGGFGGGGGGSTTVITPTDPYEFNADIEFAKLPLATNSPLPQEFLIKQNNTWKRASYGQMQIWFPGGGGGGVAITVNGEQVTVNGENVVATI